MEIKIDKDQENQRFDRFLRKFCKSYPQVKLSDIYSRIRKGNVLINGKRTTEAYRLCEGDIVDLEDELLGKKNTKLAVSQKERKFNHIDADLVRSWIIYEDNQWIVFDKPAGVVIHPSNKHWNDLCMNDYLERYCLQNKVDKNESTTFKPSFGYRLDKDTSGVLIAAKTYEALQYINEIIRNREISKEYFAIVVGKFPKHLIINKAIEKTYNAKFDRAQMQLNEDDGMDSKTECRCEKTINHPILGTISNVKVKIYSGRMHQIRIHLSSEHFPILGDLIYGKPSVNRLLYKSLHIKRQLLHCRKYQFKNIDGKTLSFQTNLPNEFKL